MAERTRTTKGIKLIALLLVSVLIFAACGTAGGGGTAAPAGDGAAAPATADAPATAADTNDADDDAPTLLIGLQSHITIEDINTNWLTLHTEEQLGVNLEFDEFAATIDDARTRFSLYGYRRPETS